MLEEVWREIPGWEGMYSVSSIGRVMSLPRTVSVQNQVPRRYALGRILKPSFRESDGYRVLLFKDGRGYARNVERLMWDAGFRT